MGKWVHPEIDNPDYTPDDKLYLYKDIGAVGVDVWQVKSGTIFDNFFIGDDFEEAWGVSKDGEKKMKDDIDAEEKKKEEEEAKLREAEEEDNEDEEEEEEEDESVKDEL